MNGTFLSIKDALPRRLVLIFALITLSVVLGVGWVLYSYQKGLLYQHSRSTSEDLAYALASSSTSWVLAHDVVGLQEVINSASHVNDLVFAAVITLDGNVLVSTRQSYNGKMLSDSVSRGLIGSAAKTQVLMDNPDLVDLAVPVLAKGKHIGWVRVEFQRDSINQSLRRVRTLGLIMAGLMCLGLFLVGRTLAQRLMSLSSISTAPSPVLERVDETQEEHGLLLSSLTHTIRPWLVWLEGIGIVGASWLVGQAVFLDWFHDSVGAIARGYWLYLLMSLGAIRFGYRGVVLLILLVGTQAYIGALEGKGFFADDLAKTGLQNYAFYMVVLFVVGMLVATFADDLRHKLQELMKLRNKERFAADLLSQMERTAHVGGWELDLRNMQLAWTPEVYRIHEEDPSHPPQLDKAINYYAPESRPIIQAAVERASQDGTPWDLELQLITAKNRRIWVRAQGKGTLQKGKVIRLNGAFQDISERKLFEQSLSRAAQYARSLLEASLDPMLTISAEGLITDVNHATEIATGLLRQQLIGSSFAEYFTDAERAKQVYREVFLNGKVVNSSLVLRGANGREIDVLYNASLYRDATQGVVGAFAIARDVTESKKVLKHLQQANADLESFSYSISHDLRTPLRAIDGFSRMLLEDYGAQLDDEGRRLLSVVRTNTDRMGRLIDDILHFSRAGRTAMNVNNVDMRDLVEVILEELQSDIELHAVKIDVAALPVIQGDRSLLHQVLTNLLSNAIKFSGKRAEPKIQVGCTQEFEQNVFFVRDNGVGFNMKYVDKLFGVFQRLHGINEFDGTGIGLAIAKRIVNRHGGRIWAEAVLEEGATFYFAIPKIIRTEML